MPLEARPWSLHRQYAVSPSQNGIEQMRSLVMKSLFNQWNERYCLNFLQLFGRAVLPCTRRWTSAKSTLAGIPLDATRCHVIMTFLSSFIHSVFDVSSITLEVKTPCQPPHPIQNHQQDAHFTYILLHQPMASLEVGSEVWWVHDSWHFGTVRTSLALNALKS